LLFPKEFKTKTLLMMRGEGLFVKLQIK